MVGDAHLAKDVTQATFLALAKTAAQLTERPVLAGWLHRTAQNIAAQTVRTDVRRRAREQEAAAMNELLATSPEADWEQIAPHLDAALGELSEPERDAVMLRYFQRQSAHDMAQTLGISDEAAQKRVSRAVDRLRECFAKRGITVGASGLAVVISANAVQAAPVGLVLTISTAATLTGTTLATTATVTATKAIAMTALQKTIVAATIAVLAGVGIYETRLASQLRAQNQALQQLQAPLNEKIQLLQNERDETTRQLAVLRDDNERLNRNTAELLKLRGEIGQLKHTAQAKKELSTTNDFMEAALLASLSRINQLKDRLEQIPDKKIPELELLTAKDWIPFGQYEDQSDSQTLMLFSDLRLRSKEKFARLTGKALVNYIEANNGQLPNDISQLAPYYSTQINSAIFQRYKLIQDGKLNESSLNHPYVIPTSEWQIGEKSVVDEEQDTLFRIGVSGYWYKGVGRVPFESGGSLSQSDIDRIRRFLQ
ncbi:MAG: RNA polymerase sigma factor [Verrucomicrobiota bacterium]